MPDLEQDSDSQDMAEIFDETNTTEDGVDIAHPDMASPLYDVTTAEDDADDDQPTDQDEYDVEELDESERELMFEEDDGIDTTRPAPRDPMDLISDETDSPADLQGD